MRLPILPPLALGILLSLPAPAAETRSLISRSGQTIEAEILEVVDESVTIRRADGQRFTIPLARLSDADQEFLRDWAVGAVLANERNVQIKASRKDTNEQKMETESEIIEKRDGFYAIEIENRGAAPIEGIDLVWKIRINRTEVGSTEERRADEWVEGTIRDVKVPVREKIELNTDLIPLVEGRLKPGWRWVNGAPPLSRDKLDGVYVALRYNGSIVREYGLPSSIVEDVAEIEREKKGK